VAATPSGTFAMSPGRLDASVVRRHLLALEHALRQLTRHAGRPLDVLRTELDEAWTVERGLQLCAQNALDVATHIAAAEAIDAPDYAAAIDALAQMKVLPARFASRFRAVAGFRDVLVHGYLEVDLARVHAVLNMHLVDFREFAEYVRIYLATVDEHS
jgi:uncharacterized protein YutE (UPF0331/DUF86 family)